MLATRKSILYLFVGYKIFYCVKMDGIVFVIAMEWILKLSTSLGKVFIIWWLRQWKWVRSYKVYYSCLSLRHCRMLLSIGKKSLKHNVNMTLESESHHNEWMGSGKWSQKKTSFVGKINYGNEIYLSLMLGTYFEDPEYIDASNIMIVALKSNKIMYLNN